MQKEDAPLKKRKRKLPPSTNQVGRGDPPEAARFELVRPPEENNFVLEVVQSKVSNNIMLQEK